MEKRIAGYAVAIVAVSILASCAKGNERLTMPPNGHQTAVLSDEDLAAVSPALERYRREALQVSLWKRPQLSLRDRSIVTIAALVARNHTAEQAHYLGVALDNGVRPSELSEIITHLAFYAGWGTAMDTVRIAQGVFEVRGISRSRDPKVRGTTDCAVPVWCWCETRPPRWNFLPALAVAKNRAILDETRVVGLRPRLLLHDLRRRARTTIPKHPPRILTAGWWRRGAGSGFILAGHEQLPETWASILAYAV